MIFQEATYGKCGKQTSASNYSRSSQQNRSVKQGQQFRNLVWMGLYPLQLQELVLYQLVPHKLLLHQNLLPVEVNARLLQRFIVFLFSGGVEQTLAKVCPLHVAASDKVLDRWEVFFHDKFQTIQTSMSIYAAFLYSSTDYLIYCFVETADKVLHPQIRPLLFSFGQEDGRLLLFFQLGVEDEAIQRRCLASLLVLEVLESVVAIGDNFIHLTGPQVQLAHPRYFYILLPHLLQPPHDGRPELPPPRRTGEEGDLLELALGAQVAVRAGAVNHDGHQELDGFHGVLVEHQLDVPRGLVAGDELFEALLEPPHPSGLAGVADGHRAGRDTVEGLAVPEGKAQDGIRCQFMLDVQGLLFFEDFEQLSALLHILNDEDAVLLVAGDGVKASNVYCHLFLYFELLALQAFSIFPPDCSLFEEIVSLYWQWLRDGHKNQRFFHLMKHFSHFLVQLFAVLGEVLAIERSVRHEKFCILDENLPPIDSLEERNLKGGLKLPYLDLLANPILEELLDLLSQLGLLPTGAVDDQIVLVDAGPQVQATCIHKIVPVFMEQLELTVWKLETGNDAVCALEEVVQVRRAVGTLRRIEHQDSLALLHGVRRGQGDRMATVIGGSKMS